MNSSVGFCVPFLFRPTPFGILLTDSLVGFHVPFLIHPPSFGILSTDSLMGFRVPFLLHLSSYRILYSCLPTGSCVLLLLRQPSVRVLTNLSMSSSIKFSSSGVHLPEAISFPFLLPFHWILSGFLLAFLCLR